MQTRAPGISRILIAIGFVLSCFGLILFLWVAFGGPTPLAAKGYEFKVPFDEATQLAVESDVRISGVSVGKVKDIELSKDGQAMTTIELDDRYAPIPKDTQATLRQKTLLGETYVELSPGSDSASDLPEDGSLSAGQVSDGVQLDEIFRTFDEPTRAAFQAWMEGASQALRGRGDDLSAAIGSLDPFARQADQALRLLDSQQVAVRDLIRNGGEVFNALSERRGQLQGLVRSSQRVFATTAARNRELARTFQIFPTFLRESRLTVARLADFSRNAEPLVRRLEPAARQLSPTLEDLGDLAPNLQRFLHGLGRAIDAAKQGVPALERLLGTDLHPLLARLDPYLAQLNPILKGVALYKHEITAFFANVAAATNNVLGAGGKIYRHLRTEPVLGAEAVSAYPERLNVNRTNPYVKPLGYQNLTSSLEGFETRQCGSGVFAVLPASVPASWPSGLLDDIRQFAFDGATSTADPSYRRPPCHNQGKYKSIGNVHQYTEYLHLWRDR